MEQPQLLHDWGGSWCLGEREALNILSSGTAGVTEMKRKQQSDFHTGRPSPLTAEREKTELARIGSQPL